MKLFNYFIKKNNNEASGRRHDAKVKNIGEYW